MVLPEEEKVLFIFKSDNPASLPFLTTPLMVCGEGEESKGDKENDACTAVCSVSYCGSCHDDFFCFTTRSIDQQGNLRERESYCHRDSAEQEKWIQALVGCGARFEEQEQSDLVQSAKSALEFKAMDIEKKDVSLEERYRGRVMLVVNVASK